MTIPSNGEKSLGQIYEFSIGHRTTRPPKIEKLHEFALEAVAQHAIASHREERLASVKSKIPDQIQEQWELIRKQISTDFDLMSVLYDLNLLPEQVDFGTRQFSYMINLCAGWIVAMDKREKVAIATSLLVKQLVEALEHMDADPQSEYALKKTYDALCAYRAAMSMEKK